MVFQKEFAPPSVKATIVLHLIDKDNFEVDDIGFDDDCFNSLSEEFEEETNEKKRKEIVGMLSLIDSLREDASEDLSEYSDITKRICKELWEKEPVERYCCINVNLWYSTSVDMFGEVDTDVEYEYEESSFDKEWNKLDFLQKGSKIYPISYEDNGSTFTVVSIFEVHGNDFQKSGIYYQLHSDKLSIMTGYYPLLVDLVDNSRYFSSEKKAHKAYVRMRENCPLQSSFVKEAEEMEENSIEREY